MKKKIYKMLSKDEYYQLIHVAGHVERTRTLDCVTLTLNREFGFGPERFKRFMDTFSEIYNEIVDLENSDVKADKQLIYSKAYVDRIIKQAVGEELFVPWEERYKPD